MTQQSILNLVVNWEVFTINIQYIPIGYSIYTITPIVSNSDRRPLPPPRIQYTVLYLLYTVDPPVNTIKGGLL